MWDMVKELFPLDCLMSYIIYGSGDCLTVLFTRHKGKSCGRS